MVHSTGKSFSEALILATTNPQYENVFLTYSWRFLMSNKLEQLEFKLEKIIGIYKHAGKIRNRNISSFLPIWP